MGTEVHIQSWTMMDKDVKLERQLPTQAVCQEQRTQAAQGEGFLPVPSKHENACCGERRVHRGNSVLDNLCVLKLDSFVCGNRKIRTWFWGI